MNFPFKFESICGNPPYQFNDGGGGFGTSASPAYHMFVEQCKQLNLRYLTLIIPSRWMIGGKSLDTFREEMLYDTHMLKLIDHIDSHDCFPNDIPGGICYFLRDSQYEGYCEVNTVINGKIDKSVRSLREDGIDVFIRYNEAISILHKVLDMNEQSFSNIVSTRHPFGLETDFRGNKTGKYKCYTSKGIRYVDDVKVGKDNINNYKVFISYVNGSSVKNVPYSVLSKPFIGIPGDICSDTYLVIGNFNNQISAENCISYIRTKFFRFLVCLKKSTPVAAAGAYQFVPLQNFSKSWTDTELYEKYNLTQKEINFIESMIKSM